MEFDAQCVAGVFTEAKPGRPQVYDSERCRRTAQQHKHQRLYRLGKAVNAALQDSV